MRIDKFKIFDVISLIDGIDETSLEFLVSALNELLIADDVAKKLLTGKIDDNTLIILFIKIPRFLE